MADPCASVRFVEPIRSELRETVLGACGELATDRVDPAVTVEIHEATPAGGGLISIFATTEGGREAFRSVTSVDDAATSVVALLMLPAATRQLDPRDATPSSAATPSPPPKATLVVNAATPSDQGPDAITEAGPARAVTVGGTVLGATRLGFGEGSSLGVGVAGSVDVTFDDAWVVGAHARVEPGTFNLDRDQIGGTFGGGPEAAYRLALEGALVDVGLGADFLAAVTSYDHRRSGEEPTGQPEDGSADGGVRGGDDRVMFDLRARAFGRFVLPTPVVSLALLAAVDVSPVSIADGPRGRDEDALPPVGLELGVGVAFRSDDLIGGGP